MTEQRAGLTPWCVGALKKSGSLSDIPRDCILSLIGYTPHQSRHIPLSEEEG